jgi:hypothetical protein
MSNYVITTDVNGSFEVLSGIVNDKLISLKLIGRGAAGYGQAIAENTVKHLSNFASSNAPLNPLKGQLWYDTGLQQIKVFGTDGQWAVIPNVNSSFWGQFLTETEGANIYLAKSDAAATYATRAYVDGNFYTKAQTDAKYATMTDLYGGGSVVTVSKGGTGLNAVGAPGTVLMANGAGTGMFWGGVVRTDSNSAPVSDNTIDIGTAGLRWRTINAVTFQGTAVQAKYADVAERYEADRIMEPGDLVDIGGEKEITLTTEAWQAAYGVISTNPAFKMNSDAGDDDTHPYVALVGRVPVKVIGQVAKGDRLTASDIPGVAMSAGKGQYPGVFGRALSAKTTDELGFVEVALGAK